MSKSAVVIGASGLIGQHVVSLLAHSDHFEKITTITRRPLAPVAEHVENHVIDFDTLDEHAELFAAADVLFCCLGTTRKQVGSLEAQYIVDLQYPISAARIARQQGIEHLLVVSSSGANTQSKSGYMRMKGELEQGLRSLSFPRLSILRPSLLLGERNDFRLGESLASWILPVLTCIPGLRKYRPITGETVAKKMVALAEKSSTQTVELLILDQIFD